MAIYDKNNNLLINAFSSTAILVIPVEKVTLNKTSVILSEEETFNLIVSITLIDSSDQSIRWTISNDTVASTNTSDQITANAVAIATITATSSNDIKAECTIYSKREEL